MSAGLTRTAERAASIGASALQIFTDNPTAWRRKPELPADLDEFRRRLHELDIGPLAIHAAYLINLAGPDNELFERSVRVLAHEYANAPAYGARYVNVHVGSHRGAGVEAGRARLADGVERVVDHVDHGPGAPLLVLENSAGGGFGLGARIEELAAVLDACAARGMDRHVRFCLDTAHLWGAGYDVASAAGIDGLLDEWSRLIGLERLVMVHLNDSYSARGSLHDHHAHVGGGEIGGDGLGHLLRHGGLDHVAFYFETPGMAEGFDAVNMARLADLAAGRPLPPLPDVTPHAAPQPRSPSRRSKVGTKRE